MSELNTFKSDYTELPLDKGTEFHHGDRIDTSPDKLSDNVFSLDEVRRKRLGQATRIDDMRFERPKELNESELAAQHLDVIGQNLAIHRIRKAA